MKRRFALEMEATHGQKLMEDTLNIVEGEAKARKIKNIETQLEEERIRKEELENERIALLGNRQMTREQRAERLRSIHEGINNIIEKRFELKNEKIELEFN